MFILETSPYFQDLDWEKLKSFYYVAKVGNISHAASFFNLNQTSFSRHITGLERHLGYPLFIRTRNGVTLNRKGKELFVIVENIFISMKGFIYRSYTTTAQRQKRKIRVAISSDLAAYFLNDLILEYNKDHPDLVFELIVVDHPIDIILHDVDIAIQPCEPKNEGAAWQIIQEPFFTLEKKLYASPQYLEKYGEPLTVDDLRNHHFIVPSIPEAYSFNDTERNLGLRFEKQGKKDVKRQEPIFMSNSLECLIVAAQQGKGIISMYDKMAIIQKANLKNILPDLIIKKRQEYCIYPEYLKDDPNIIHIKDYLIKEAGEKVFVI